MFRGFKNGIRIFHGRSSTPRSTCCLTSLKVGFLGLGDTVGCWWMMLNCGWLLAGGSLIGVKVVVHSHLVHWVVNGKLSGNCSKMEGGFCVASDWGCLKGFLYALLGMKEGRLMHNGVYGESRMIRSDHR